MVSPGRVAGAGCRDGADAGGARSIEREPAVESVSEAAVDGEGDGREGSGGV